jgi:hypothetical protein
MQLGGSDFIFVALLVALGSGTHGEHEALVINCSFVSI